MRVLPKTIVKTLGGILLVGAGNMANAANPPADPIQKTKPDCSSTNTTQDYAIEGRRAFVRLNCYSCHGMGGHGASMGPSLVGKANEADVVMEGDGHGMPGYPNNLCSNDVRNIRAYLTLLGTGTEPSFTHWWDKGVPSR